MEREWNLERRLVDLLNIEEFQGTELSEATHRVIREAHLLLDTESDELTHDDLAQTLEYITEQVEMLRIAFDHLFREVMTIKQAVMKKRETQKTLF